MEAQDQVRPESRSVASMESLVREMFENFFKLSELLLRGAAGEE